MESVFKVTIERLDSGKYQATYQMGKSGGSQPFDTIDEAAAFIDKLETEYDQSNEEATMAQDEKAASQINPDEAEEINSDVRLHGDVSDPLEQQPSEKLDKGAGNREAPHKTNEEANDPDNEKGRAN